MRRYCHRPHVSEVRRAVQSRSRLSSDELARAMHAQRIYDHTREKMLRLKKTASARVPAEIIPTTSFVL
jgi:hypothetical protein